jgi:hypothetical protein
MATPHPVPPVTNHGSETYDFTLKEFEIKHTRSIHNDTDVVNLYLAVGNNPAQKQQKSIGDVNDGHHKVGLTISNVKVGPNDKVAFTYVIMNQGHKNKGKLEGALDTGISELTSKAAAAVGDFAGGPAGAAIAGQASNWIAKHLQDLISPDRDGPVAVATHVFTGTQLAQATASGKPLTTTEDNAHTSNRGNARYNVTFTIQRREHQVAKAG